MAKLSLFNIIDRLTILKEPIDFRDDDEAKSYDVFMVDKALSMCEVLIPIVCDVVRMNLPKEAHAAYYMEVLPKRKIYINWIKADKDLSLEEREMISDYYNCSMKKADMYLGIMTKEQIASVLKNYKYGVGKKINV